MSSTLKRMRDLGLIEPDTSKKVYANYELLVVKINQAVVKPEFDGVIPYTQIISETVTDTENVALYKKMMNNYLYLNANKSVPILERLMYASDRKLSGSLVSQWGTKTDSATKSKAGSEFAHYLQLLYYGRMLVTKNEIDAYNLLLILRSICQVVLDYRRSQVDPFLIDGKTRWTDVTSEVETAFKLFAAKY